MKYLEFCPYNFVLYSGQRGLYGVTNYLVKDDLCEK